MTPSPCSSDHPQYIVGSYDTEGNGEMTLSELTSAMGEVVGLTKEDVMPMFSQSGKMEDVSVDSTEEFAHFRPRCTNYKGRRDYLRSLPWWSLKRLVFNSNFGWIHLLQNDDEILTAIVVRHVGW